MIFSKIQKIFESLKTMNTKITIDNQEYMVNLSKPLDISMPLVPNVENVNCYYAEQPQSEIIRMGNFVGRIGEGGSVNYEKLTLTPHGNGTHTECYGHISADEVTINQVLRQFHFVAKLVSVAPEKLSNDDFVITLQTIENQLNNEFCQALILRTLPNTNKKLRQYSGTNPPYLLPEIGDFLRKKNIQHLLVDLPSVDKESDGGALRMHKAFWNYPDNPRKNATITELIYVPDEIADGNYLLNLQIMSLEMDASPSKPILYYIN